MKAELDVDDLLRNNGYTDNLYSTVRSPASIARSNTSNHHLRTHVTRQNPFLNIVRRLLAGKPWILATESLAIEDHCMFSYEDVAR